MPNVQPVKLTKKQANNKYVRHRGIMAKTTKLPKKLFAQRRQQIIHELRLPLRHVIGVLMPSDDNGGSRPYTVSDGNWDVKHGYQR